MDEGARKFLEAEERANQLVEALQKLYEEVNSYQETSRNLQTVREELGNLIVNLKEIVIGNQEISRLLGEINAQDILEKLMNLENDFKAYAAQSLSLREELQNVTQQVAALEERFRSFAQEENHRITEIQGEILNLKDPFTTLQGLLENNLRETAEIKNSLSQQTQALDRLNNRMVVEGRQTGESLAMLQKWVYIAAGLAGIGMVMSIIALFR